MVSRKRVEREDGLGDGNGQRRRGGIEKKQWTRGTRAETRSRSEMGFM